MSYISNKLRGINAFLILPAIIILISCSGTSVFSDDNLLVKMEKTSCYGQCPVYTVRIDRNGNGIFTGEENTEPLGTYKFRLSEEEMEELKSFFDKAGFRDMKDRYYENLTDLPTTWLTYREGGSEKKVMDYYGAPEELKILEKQVEAMVLSRKLKKSRQNP